MNNPHQGARLAVHSRERIVARLLSGQAAAEVAAAFAVSLRRVRKWLARFRAGRSARVAELLALVRRDPAMMRCCPHAFSGGQRQRIVIGRALAVNPAFVVCDEPVSAPDVRTRARIVALSRDLQARLGLSCLFIAHDLAILREVAHRVAVMVGGRIFEIGEADRVHDAPEHPCTRALLEAVAVPDPAVRRARLRRPADEGPRSG